jgi:hypothetical protein
MATSSAMPEAAEEWQISFRGSASPQAEELAQQLACAGVSVPPPKQITQTEPTLGAGEIILEIVMSAAFKAVVGVAMDRLKEYLVRQLQATESKPNLQVVVLDAKLQSRKKFLLSLRNASQATVGVFVDNIKASMLKVAEDKK